MTITLNAHAHPQDPLSAAEILAAVAATRAHLAQGGYAGAPIERALFNSVSLCEPSKYAVLQWSGLFTEKEIAAVAGGTHELKRQADIHLICPVTAQSFEVIVDLPSNIPSLSTVDTATVTGWILLPRDSQPSLQTEASVTLDTSRTTLLCGRHYFADNVDFQELLEAEVVCKNDPQVKAACEAVGIDQADIFVDGWCIGGDDRFPDRRLQQCFIFTRARPGDNLYAHPADFIPVIDSHTGEVLTIDFPHLNASTFPSSHAAHAALEARERFAPPAASHNYLPEQIAQDDPTFKLRDTLKPLHVIQPEGVSYSLAGRVISWQNWKLHIGFSYREGLILSNVTYKDGAKGERPLFYRMSVAEMVVPTIYPHHRKHAFDTGEYGIGALANSLALGCDCLGSITYLDADFVTRAGGIETIKSAVCIHEEDAGILHKHTDFRDGRAHVARNRKLVISSICTVANYEYGFYFNFALDGSVELEVKATGIVNAYALAPGEPQDLAHEVEVAPRVVAQHHQHLFSFRVDPMIDGLRNRVVEVDSVPDDDGLGSDSNFYGNGFKTVKTVLKTAKDAQRDYDAARARAWAIENPAKQHYASGANIAYKVVSKDMPPLLAKPGSMVWNRAPFARHNKMFVTPYAPNELYPSDMHINQNPGGEQFGLAEWVARDEPVEDRDIVVWPCFGVTHISRPEDWPIMPVEILRVHLKPAGFFDRNPGLDVPSSADAKSRNADEAFVGATTDGCCSSK